MLTNLAVLTAAGKLRL